MIDELAQRRARVAAEERADVEVDVCIDIVESMSEEEAKDLLVSLIDDVGRLTAALNETHPGELGRNEASVDCAIRLLRERAGVG